MNELSVSILNADFYCLKKQLDILKDNGYDLLHIDVMDGSFVDNISFAFPVLESIKDKGFTFDIHLMINNPEKHIKRFAEYASILTVHYEAIKNNYKILDDIRKLGVRSGISINPDTDHLALVPLMGKFDLVLIMSVFPGYGGQKFMPEVLDKAHLLHGFKKQYGFIMEIDGGINFDNIEKVKSMNIFDHIVMGSSIMNDNIEENIKKLRSIL